MSSIRELDVFGRRHRPESYSLNGNQKKSYDYEKRVYMKYDFSPSSLQGLTECVVASVLERCTYRGYPIKYVPYKVYTEGKMRGVHSPSFVPLGSSEVSIASILARSDPDIISKLNGVTVSERLQGAIDICVKYTGVHGVSEFVGLQFLLDYLFLNIDRHWGNISFIRGPEGHYEFAPYFDFAESYKALDVSNMTHEWLHFEPNPYLQEQLECLDELLTAHLSFNFQEWLQDISAKKKAWERVYTPEEITVVCNRFLTALSTFPRKDLLEVL